jgi:hypothetical protein
MLVVAQLLRKIPHLLWNLTFVTMFMRAHHSNLSWATWIQFTSFKLSSFFKIQVVSSLRLSNPLLNSWMSVGCEVLTAVVMKSYVFWEANCLPHASRLFLAWLTLQPLRWRPCVPPKRRLTINILRKRYIPEDITLLQCELHVPPTLSSLI